jgi:integral membrane protein
VKGALTFYRVMAYIAGVVLLLFCLAIFLYHVTHTISSDWLFAAAHGWIFVIYIVAAVNLAFRAKWGLIRTLLTCLAGTIPFLSFVAEHYASKQVHALMAAQESDAGAPTV